MRIAVSGSPLWLTPTSATTTVRSGSWKSNWRAPRSIFGSSAAVEREVLGVEGLSARPFLVPALQIAQFCIRGLVQDATVALQFQMHRRKSRLESEQAVVLGGAD